jgi:hypothetical protein
MAASHWPLCAHTTALLVRCKHGLSISSAQALHICCILSIVGFWHSSLLSPPPRGNLRPHQATKECLCQPPTSRPSAPCSCAACTSQQAPGDSMHILANSRPPGHPSHPPPRTQPCLMPPGAPQASSLKPAAEACAKARGASAVVQHASTRVPRWAP